MVTKVGSAGQVIESVIQYTQNDNRQELKTDAAPEKNERKRISYSAGLNGPTDRLTSFRERAAETNAKLAAAHKNTDSAVEQKQIVAPVQDVAVIETTGGEIIENRSELELSQEAVKITVEDVNKRIAPQGAHVEFSYHEKTGRYSFKVLDKETGEILREVPPQKSLDMVAKMFEMAGLIVDEKL